MKVGLAQHPVFLEHDNGPGHPERPERLRAIAARLEQLPLRADLASLDTRDATRGELEAVHAARYLDQLEKTRDRPLTILDPDTSANERSMAAAVRAAGSAVVAVETAVSGALARSFVLCRPPGHHAEADRAMGFCLVNSVAVAAAAAIAANGLSRVAIVDWDVHHGNGTDHIFSSRSDVLYASVHQFPHYPGTGMVNETGHGQGAGYSVNVPLPSGCTDSDYAAVMDRVIVPILRAYRPELLLVSAGFDAHQSDPLAGMLVTTAGYRYMTSRLVSVAEEFASGRIVHVLEGGYDLEALAGGVGAVLSVLTEDDETSASGVTGGTSPAAATVIDAVLRAQSDFWSIPDKS